MNDNIVAKTIDNISEIWKGNIQNLYSEGSICSEKPLQAEIFKYLSLGLEENPGLKVWVEPLLTNDQKNIPFNKIPDLLVTYKEDVVNIIELKYKPSGYVKFEDDLQKFKLIVELANANEIEICLQRDPTNGYRNYTNGYKITKDTLFTFGVIAKNDSAALKKEIWVNSTYKKLHLTGSVGGKRIFDAIEYP